MDAQDKGTETSDERTSSPTHDRSANALRHGLAGTKHLPPSLQHGRVEELFQRLKEEVQPTSFLEELSLREIARHAAILDVIEVGEPAVMRQAAHGMAGLIAVDGDVNEDLAMALAVTAEPLERVSRYRRAHEKALHAALDRIVAPRQPADERARPMPAAPKDRRFATTEAYESYLSQRFLSATWSCPWCGSRAGTYRKRLKAWACASCNRIIGLRQGTIFARSPVRLQIWFRAIDVVAADLNIEACELAERLAIKRLATVRKMLHKIRVALASGEMTLPNATPIDTVVHYVLPNAFLRNENPTSPTSRRHANHLPANS
jgi:transposase-like protein